MKTKTCTKCRTEKSPDEFNRDRSREDGRFPWCKLCKRAGDSAGHAKYRPARTAAMRARYHADPEPYRAYQRARYAANSTSEIERVKLWQAANPERVREIKRASQARAWAADPERFREAWRKRKAAVKRGCEVFEFGPAELAEKIRYWGGRCWMCGAAADCVDHVKPLAAGGPHMLANLRPACTSCNARKRHTWPLPPSLRNRAGRGLISA